MPAVSYKAVIFDIGGVILPSPFDAWATYESEIGLPVGFIRRVVAAGGETGAWSRLERNEISLEQFVSTFEAECAAAGGTVSAREVLSRIGTGAGAPREEMLTAIRRIKEEGLKTAAITNNFVREGGGRGGFRENLFDLVVESSILGIRKPDTRIYIHTCELLAIQPNEAVFLDDLGVNLKPARELGMTTIKVIDPHEALAELEKTLQFSVRTSTESI